MDTTIRSVMNDPPPEGVVVETLSKKGVAQRLKQYGGFWCTPDGTYVYYTPVVWAYPGDEA